MTTFAREWSMPTRDTFSMKPIATLLAKYVQYGMVVVDPFARSSKWATISNDLDPSANTDYHMDAREFLKMLDVEVDVFLLDPPYSPRQISECYKSIGLPVSAQDTQNARLYAECKALATPLLKHGGIAITCGWNSGGFGTTRGFELEHVLLVPHGAAHNDTIVTVERKVR